MAGSICDCCRREEQKVVGVCSSSLGPVSWAFCQECLDHIAEPECGFDYLYDFVADSLSGVAEWCQQFTTFKDGRYWSIQEWYEWRADQPPSTIFEQYLNSCDNVSSNEDDFWPEPVEDFTSTDKSAINIFQ